MKPKVIIVTFPWKSRAPFIFLKHMIKILSEISEEVHVVTSPIVKVKRDNVFYHDINIRVHYLNEIKPKIYSAILWILKCIIIQIKISITLVKLKRNRAVDAVIFYMSYPYHLLPLITLKLINVKSLEVITRGNSISRSYDTLLFYLLDGISPEYYSLIKIFRLYKYKNKLLLPPGYRYIDTQRWKMTRPLELRDNIIGYIGRLREEKGILEFIEAINHLKDKKDFLKFMIIGSGDLDKIIDKKIKELRTNGIIVKRYRWIENEKLPEYLNNMKLLVLPSHSEGLPTVLIEAMACGTPVLATSVGAIPDIVIEHISGFLLIKPNPSEIKHKIVQAIEDKLTLKRVSKRSYIIAKEKFNYQVAIKRWKLILNRIAEGDHNEKS